MLTAIDLLNIGSLKIDGTGEVDLSAWTDDTSPYAGVLFHQDSRLIAPEPWHIIVRDWLLGRPPRKASTGSAAWRAFSAMPSACRSAPLCRPTTESAAGSVGPFCSRPDATAANWAKVKLWQNLIPRIGDPGAVEVAQSTVADGSTESPAPAAQTGTERGTVNSALDLSQLSRGELEALETLVTNSGASARTDRAA